MSIMTVKKTHKRIVITLKPAQRIALDKINAETGAPIAVLIRKAIDQFLVKK
jgi:Ribbon-helix-helix domain